MANVYLSIGSNVNRSENIRSCIDSLSAIFGQLSLSPVYESTAVGFEGDNFYNLVVGVETNLRVGELSTILKKIEDQHGRDRKAPKFGPRTLDIDIITVDDMVGEVDGIKLPRDELLKNAFVLLPMAVLIGDQLHPETGLSYQSHWERFDKSKQFLKEIDF